jgi:hypothetical protein
MLRNEGSSQEELNDLSTHLQNMGQPTVWQEIKRQREWIPELQDCSIRPLRRWAGNGLGGSRQPAPTVSRRVGAGIGLHCMAA